MFCQTSPTDAAAMIAATPLASAFQLGLVKFLKRGDTLIRRIFEG
jgi:hypothetical protein